jgi:hypothetical protein
MKILKRLWLIIPVLVLQGCPGGYGYKYNTGSFPVNPVNFTEMNTEYDDYNSTSPVLGEAVPLCFSTNRNSKGKNFDLIYKPFSIVFEKSTGELKIGANTEVHGEWMLRNANLTNGVRKVSTPGDEFGPYLIFVDRVSLENYEVYNSYIMLYSNNEDEDQDIRYSHNTNSINWEDPLPVSFLNSNADDAYPSFNADRSALYFCSDRDQNFDIYRVSTDPEKGIVELLESEESLPIEKDTVLSSEWDDKCPYIAFNGFYESQYEELDHNMLVFTSNREGGFGGFDLYYSMLENGQWGEPINFGAGINTEYDEYRPIVRPQYDFTNDFMLFSSNRPGGLGGFDLYYVGIPDIGRSY